MAQTVAQVQITTLMQPTQDKIKRISPQKHLMLTMLSPYLVKLATFDITVVLLILAGKVTTQLGLMCGGKVFDGFVCKSFLSTFVKGK